MSVSKISDFKTLFVDLRPGSVYNQEKIRGVYKDYYDLPLSKTMVGGKRLTIEELVQGSESNEVTITEEGYQAFNSGRTFPVEYFTITSFSAMIMGVPTDFSVLFIGHQVEFNGKRSYVVTSFTNRSGLGADVISSFRPDATTKGAALSDWVKRSFGRYPHLVNCKTVSLSLDVSKMTPDELLALYEERVAVLTTEIATVLDFSIKNLSDI